MILPNNLILSLLAAAMILATAGATRASVLVLPNGDRLTGTVTRRAGGTLYFTSDVLGPIAVPEKGATVLDSPAAGPTATPVAVAKPRKAPVASMTPPKGWIRKVEFGYDNTVSNDIRTVSLDLRDEFERTINLNNYKFTSQFQYGSIGGVATMDEEDAAARWRHTLSGRLFSQSDTTYETDKVKRIHYQAEQNAGLGYKIIQSRGHTVDIGAGLTGEQLDAAGVQKGFTYLGNMFQDYTYKINGRYTFSEDVTAQYSPESRGLSGVVPDTITPATGNQRDYDYKLHTTLSGKISDHVSLNLHFEYQYDNAVADPTTRAEQRVTTTLGYGF